jgi:murein tripeptide amidase MpaA
MLNPDGVARGLHRCNARGEDMNRSYLAPDAARHPVVSAVRNALTKWVSQGEQVALFADLHAHTKKRGVFVFGNELQSAESQVENVLFPKLVALHTQHFDFRASVFGRMDVAGRRDHIWFVRKNFGCSLFS